MVKITEKVAAKQDAPTGHTVTFPANAPADADQILVSDANGNLSYEPKPTGANIATTMAFA